jgi:transcriptional regulator with XRE-family HTH domain
VRLARKKTILNPSPDASTLGGRLRTVRVMAGLTLREAAQRVGLSHNAVAGYEQHLFTPPLFTLGQLPGLYPVAVAWLFDGRPTPEAAEVLTRLEPWLRGLPALARERLTLVVRMSPAPGKGATPWATTQPEDRPSAMPV